MRFPTLAYPLFILLALVHLQDFSSALPTRRSEELRASVDSTLTSKNSENGLGKPLVRFHGYTSSNRASVIENILHNVVPPAPASLPDLKHVTFDKPTPGVDGRPEAESNHPPLSVRADKPIQTGGSSSSRSAATVPPPPAQAQPPAKVKKYTRIQLPSGEIRYKCNYHGCQKPYYLHAHDAAYHYDAIHQDKLRACKECPAVFKYPSTLCEHRRKNHPQTPKQVDPCWCANCGANIVTDVQLAAHGENCSEMPVGHPQPSVQEIGYSWCAFCHAGFAKVAQLAAHAKNCPKRPGGAIRRGGGSATASPLPTPTPSLHKRADIRHASHSPGSLRRHIDGRDDNDILAPRSGTPSTQTGTPVANPTPTPSSTPVASGSGSQPPPQQPPDGDKPYPCLEPGCSASFRHKKNRRVHHNIVHLGATPWCEACDKTFNSTSGLRAHELAIHKKVTFACRHGCEKTYTRQSNRKTHERLVHEGGVGPPDTLTCPHCGKVLQTKGSVGRHLMICKKNLDRPARGGGNEGASGSSAGPPHTCPHCGKVLKTKRNLDRHITTCKKNLNRGGGGDEGASGSSAGPASLNARSDTQFDDITATRSGESIPSSNFVAHIAPAPASVPVAPGSQAKRAPLGVLTDGNRLQQRRTTYKCKVCGLVVDTKKAAAAHWDKHTAERSQPSGDAESKPDTTDGARLPSRHRRIEENASKQKQNAAVAPRDDKPPPTPTGASMGHATPTPASNAAASGSHAPTSEVTKFIRVKMPSGRTKFKCAHEGCPKSFTAKCNAEGHYDAIHDNGKYPCDEPGCTAVFGYRKNLTRHKNTIHHSGEGPEEGMAGDGEVKPGTGSDERAGLPPRHRRIQENALKGRRDVVRYQWE